MAAIVVPVAAVLADCAFPLQDARRSDSVVSCVGDGVRSPCGLRRRLAIVHRSVWIHPACIARNAFGRRLAGGAGDSFGRRVAVGDGSDRGRRSPRFGVARRDALARRRPAHRRSYGDAAADPFFIDSCRAPVGDSDSYGHDRDRSFSGSHAGRRGLHPTGSQRRRRANDDARAVAVVARSPPGLLGVALLRWRDSCLRPMHQTKPLPWTPAAKALAAAAIVVFLLALMPLVGLFWQLGLVGGDPETVHWSPSVARTYLGESFREVLTSRRFDKRNAAPSTRVVAKHPRRRGDARGGGSDSLVVALGGNTRSMVRRSARRLAGGVAGAGRRARADGSLQCVMDA